MTDQAIVSHDEYGNGVFTVCVDAGESCALQSRETAFPAANGWSEVRWRDTRLARCPALQGARAAQGVDHGVIALVAGIFPELAGGDPA